MKRMPDTGEAYRAAIVDWATNGADSRFAMSPDARDRRVTAATVRAQPSRGVLRTGTTSVRAG